MFIRSLNNLLHWVNPRRPPHASYKQPQGINLTMKEARLENGVLTPKLAKVLPESKALRPAIN